MGRRIGDPEQVDVDGEDLVEPLVYVQLFDGGMAHFDLPGGDVGGRPRAGPFYRRSGAVHREEKPVVELLRDQFGRDAGTWSDLQDPIAWLHVEHVERRRDARGDLRPH